MASLDSARMRGQSQIPDGLKVVPNSAADLTTTDTWIFQIVVANKTGSAVTFTVKDKQSTPLELFNAVSLAANSITVAAFPEGVKMIGGVNWVAGTASALIAEVYAFRKG